MPCIERLTPETGAVAWTSVRQRWPVLALRSLANRCHLRVLNMWFEMEQNHKIAVCDPKTLSESYYQLTELNRHRQKKVFKICLSLLSFSDLMFLLKLVV